ncbi:LuxR C-terminal-related transcriptional regulator [Streptomyces sp. TRM70308]|uniref:ATP-binding protein n=1 Tax=Streptomyces sp. TRM70308 TaxID=3131932 RepID=UPI003D01675F
MNLPRDATPYIGRRRESAEVRAALRPGRLVTLTGPGGVGKTRLARAVAAQTAGEFSGGADFVDLTELRDGTLLPDLVATRLGLRNQSGRAALGLVVSHLREQARLLVLDNCEHVVTAVAPFVAAVLAECPRVVVLGTSRQSLGVVGERVLRVDPLAVPGEGAAASPPELVRYDAVALFAERASAVVPDFRLTTDNSLAVVRICRRLEGLPLAIELAASRLRSLSPQQIADRLRRRLPLLTSGPRTAPERQRTLRATIDWSYSLCSPAERAVWRRASVFAGTFDLAAVEHVCTGPDAGGEDVLDAVEGLLDKCVLLREEHEGVVRYRMLETLRERGQELQEEAGEKVRVSRRHRDWIDELTALADAELMSAEQSAWFGRLRLEHANLRAALEWSLSEAGEAGAVLRIAARLDEYWWFFGHSRECRQWLDRALDMTAPDHPDRLWAMAVCALHTVWSLDLDGAAARLDRVEALAAARGDELVTAFLTYVRALAAQIGVDPRAAELAAEAAEAFRAQGEVRREMHPLWIFGVTSGYRRGDLVEGRRSLHRMAALCEARGETHYLVMAQFGLAYLEVERGDVGAAEDLARKALHHQMRIGAGPGAAYLLEGFAWIADRKGEYRRSATLFGAAATLWRACGSDPEVAVSGPHRAHRTSTLAALGEHAFAQAFAAGRRMTEASAVRYALGRATGEDLGRPEVLTARQWQIADLVARGMSNRDIAATLVISQRTVDSHVQNILDRLGARKRAQIAVWFATHG